jgi:hypothetical protein
MHVHLLTTTWDVFGAVSIEPLPSTDYGSSDRRVTRIATLDGGVVYNDFGHADGDRTMTIRWTYDATTHAAVERLIRYYGTVFVSTREGFFLAAIHRHDVQQSTSALRLLILDKLAEN